MYVRNKKFKKSIFTPWTWEEHVDLLLILGVLWPLLEAEVLAGDGPGVDDKAVVHGEADLGTGGIYYKGSYYDSCSEEKVFQHAWGRATVSPSLTKKLGSSPEESMARQEGTEARTRLFHTIHSPK